MTVLVQSILTNPLGAAIPAATIRITAKELSGSTPKNAEAIYLTSELGEYSFELEEGQYNIEVLLDGEFISSGSILVDAFTPSPIDISTLVQYSTPVSIPVVVPEDTVWEDLHADLRTDIDTETRSNTSQLSDNTVLVNETKQLTQNTRIDGDMAEESVITQSRTTTLNQQTNVYEDSNNNQSIQVSSTGSTETANLSKSTGLYESSNGKVSIHQENTLTSPSGSVSEHIDFDDLELVNSKALNWDEANITESANVDAEGIRKDITTSIGTVISGNRYEELKEVYRDQDSIEVTAPKIELGSTTQLDSGIHTADIYEKQTALVDKDDQLQTTQERGITAYLKKAFQRITNNGFLSKLVTQVDKYQIQNDAEEVLADFDTVNKTLTINGSLTVNNADQFKGEKGDTIYEVFQYSEDNITWFDTWEEGRRYRRHATSTNGVVGSYSAGYLLDGKDGADGDTTYVEYQYSDDNVNWHSVFVDGDIWRKERTVLNGVPQGLWSDAARIKGSDGADGEITEIAYQYSVDGFDPWHSNFSTGDHYRRERVEYFYTVADREAGSPYQTTAWSSAAKLVPKEGVDYGYKHATVMLYQRKTTTPPAPTGDVSYDLLNLTFSSDVGVMGDWETSIPAGVDPLWVAVASVYTLGSSDTIASNEWVIEQMAARGIDGISGKDGAYNTYVFANGDTIPNTPVGGSFDGTTEIIPAGWTDDPVESGTSNTWISKARYTDNGTAWVRTDEWSVPVQWTGHNGYQSAFVPLFKVSAFTPTVPANPLTYAFADGTVSGSLEGWSRAAPSNTAEGGTVWTTFNTAFAQVGNSTDTLDPADWSIPEVLVKNGTNGINGQAGSHGSGSYVILTAAATSKATVQGYSQATKDSHFSAAGVANRVPQDKDILSYVNDSNLDETLRFRVDYLYNGTDWVEFTSVINGNQIVHGTIAAEHIQAGSITGDRINSDTVITGHIDAKSLTFTGSIPTSIDNSTLTKANVTATGLVAGDVGADVAGAAATAEQNAKDYADTTFVTSVTYDTDIAAIQNQIDKSITTWFYNGEPTLANLPASDWTTDPDKDIHLGDLYYDGDTGYAYRFQLNASVYSWIKLVDSDLTLALSTASTAQDTADSKRRVFVATPTVPYDIGDLWDTGSGIKRSTVDQVTAYTAGDWVDVADVTDYDAAAQTAQNKADAAETNAVNKAYGQHNLLPDASFSNDFLSGQRPEAFHDYGGTLNSANITLTSRDASDAWGLNYGGYTGEIIQTGTESDWNKYYEVANRLSEYPVSEGQTYGFSVYTGAHRCKVAIFLQFLDINLQQVSSHTDVNDKEKDGGSNLTGTGISGYKRLFAYGTAPTNARYVRCYIRKYDTQSGSTSHLFYVMPQLSLLAAGQTTPPAWVAGTSNSLNLLLNANTPVNGAKIQIKSDNYVQNSAGWAIDSSGNAEFSNVTVRGHIEATSGHIKSNITVGSTIDANNYLQLRGANASGSTQTGIQIVKDGTGRFRLDMDGRMRIYNGSNTYMDINPNTGVATFNGIVQADKIDADVVAAAAKSITGMSDQVTVSTQYTGTLATFTVGTSNSSVTRHLHIPPIRLDELSIVNDHTAGKQVDAFLQVSKDAGAWTTVDTLTVKAGWESSNENLNVAFSAYTTTFGSSGGTLAIRIGYTRDNTLGSAYIAFSTQTLLGSLYRAGTSLT